MSAVMTNQNKTRRADLCVIGAGAAGLSVAAGAARLGLDVVLFEKDEMGGECLNTGCVPSKALLAAAHHAQSIREASAFGLTAGEPEIDFPAIMAHVHERIAAIAPADSQERFEGLGVEVVREPVRFLDEDTVQSASLTVTAKRFVLATGSKPFVPLIEGVESVPYLTNETLFDITGRPSHLIIIGAGAAGLEMAQAFRRLGSEVTVLEALTPLAQADPDHAAALLERLRGEGVTIHAETKARRVVKTANGVRVAYEGAQNGEVEGSRLFIAAGRKVLTEGLALDAAGIAHDGKRIQADDRLRTTNKRVFLAGDAAGLDMLTHAAGWHASVLIRNFYFAQRTRAASALIPKAIYTDPEFAWIGQSEAEAREEHGDKVKLVEWTFDENDRAKTERGETGSVKLIAGKGGRILGASVLSDNAGEILQIVQAAIASGGSVKSLTGYVPAYPTRGEAVKRAAGAYYEDAVFGPLARRLARFLTYFQ